MDSLKNALVQAGFTAPTDPEHELVSKYHHALQPLVSELVRLGNESGRGPNAIEMMLLRVPNTIDGKKKTLQMIIDRLKAEK